VENSAEAFAGGQDLDAQLKTTREMWVTLRRKNSCKVRNALVEKYMPLVKMIAKKIITKLPRSVQLADLKSAGTFGLICAIDGYDIHRGVQFETYCAGRIRGAILDELRRLDWVPRLVRKRRNQLETVVKALEADLGRKPTMTEVAEKLDVSEKELSKVVRDSRLAGMISLNATFSDDDDNKPYKTLDFIEDKKTPDPLEFLKRRELIDIISGELSREERLIILLYYYEQITMKEIGLALDVSESRVCQMHSQILKRLRRRLAERREELMA
jgi:RNA polymerase sigma factor for flagellar operon FliA